MRPDYVKRLVDILFSEKVLRSETTEKDILLDSISVDKGVVTVWRKIDTRNREKLFVLASKKLSKYLRTEYVFSIHKFREKFIKQAEEWQKCFPHYETKKEEKEYCVDLQNWIDMLRVFDIDNLIDYYKGSLNRVFNEIHHSVYTICEYAKPICPELKPSKYIEYFLQKIDFDKIEDNPCEEETCKYCKKETRENCIAIHYGLETIFRTDFDKAIQNYQSNISQLSKEQIIQTQKQLIEIIGNLKRQTRNNKAGSFSTRGTPFLDNLENRVRLDVLEYRIFIGDITATFGNDLLSTYEIINETFKELTPLLTESSLERISSNITNANGVQQTITELAPVKSDEQTFEVYLNIEGKKVLPFLIKNYKDAKPQRIAFMLFALSDLGLIDKNDFRDNQTQLHNAMCKAFGNVGTRQSLHSNISILEGASAYHNKQIESHRKQIKEAISMN